MKRTTITMTKAGNAYELLDDVAAAMLAEPRRVDMGTWFKRILTKTFRPQSGIDMKDGEPDARRTYITAPACGTVGCIAGWVATLTTPAKQRDELLHFQFVSVRDTARRLLGDNSEAMRSDIHDLFHGTAPTSESFKPKEFRVVPYPFPKHRVGTKAYVRDVVANIRKFQAKWEAQLRAKAVS